MCNWAAEINPQALLHRADRKDTPRAPCSKGCSSFIFSFLFSFSSGTDGVNSLYGAACLDAPLCPTQTSKAASSRRTTGHTPNPVKLHPPKVQRCTQPLKESRSGEYRGGEYPAPSLAPNGWSKSSENLSPHPASLSLGATREMPAPSVTFPARCHILDPRRPKPSRPSVVPISSFTHP